MSNNSYKTDVVDCIVALAIKESYDVVIQTSDSIIFGTPIKNSNKDLHSAVKIFFNAFDMKQDLKAKSIKQDPETFLSTQAIFLKDVKVTGSYSLSTPFMVVFVDQISSISLGSVD